MPLVSKKMITVAFTCDLLIIAFFSVDEVGVFHCIDCLFVFFSISQEMIYVALLDFNPSHESGRTTQYGHTQTKLYMQTS
jgi:hypothetical protein